MTDQITGLRLQNFRSYGDEAVELNPGVNIIVGPNASGKTNILEAIELSCLGRSHRQSGQLVRFGRPWARLDLQTTTGERIVKIERLYREEPEDVRIIKSYEIAGQALKRLPLAKQLPVVTFEPNHLQLLISKPELRRDFLDDLIEQIEPGFSVARQAFKRTLSQRNALLKRGPGDLTQQLFAWDIRFSQLGGQIVAERRRLVELFNKDIARIYRKLTGSRAKVEVNYSTKLGGPNYESQLLKKLQSNLETDRARGFTSYGPQRDDLVFTINGHQASETASRGEIRTIMLALKMLEVQVIEKARGQKPILLLDDVFSELDGARRQALTAFLQGYQSFISTTDADVVVQHFMDQCHIIATSK